MIRITAENAVSYPDEFSKDWLVEIIKGLRERYQSDGNGSKQRENPLFYFLDRVRFNKSGWGYSRVSELIRRLIKAPQTADMVNRCLSDLMRLHYFDAALNVIKRLRFASEFDGLYWLKQLFDRGDSDIRSQAFNYLYYTLREADADIHRTLGRLDPWLPAADRDRRDYPKSAGFALRLLIKYCFEMIVRSNENDDSRPIFSDQTADEEIRLVRWLLHPAVPGALRESQSESWMKRFPRDLDDRKKADRLIGILLAEWSVILSSQSQSSTTSEDETATRINNKAEPLKQTLDMFNRILTQVGEGMSDARRREIVTNWEESNRELLRSITNTAPTKQQREQLAAQREQEAVRWDRVFSLTQRFRNLYITATES